MPPAKQFLHRARATGGDNSPLGDSIKNEGYRTPKARAADGKIGGPFECQSRYKRSSVTVT
jgi:hypothetical protein